MGVVALWRYPVKAMLGELLDAVRVTAGGLTGDRRFIVVDEATGERIAAKRGPTDPRLRACRAELGEDGRLRLTLPDGTSARHDEAEDALSDLLERDVRLDRAPNDDEGRLGAPGAHHDYAPVHLLTTGTLAHLRRQAPESDWDERRFRPNLVLDDAAPFGEDRLVGGALHQEGLRLEVGVATPRCVVPTREREELPRDPGLLRTLVREHRVDLGPFGRRPCLGAYAEVASEGRVAVGDRLEVSSA